MTMTTTTTEPPEVVRLNVIIDRTLYRRFQQYAFDRSTNVSSINRQLIEDLLGEA